MPGRLGALAMLLLCVLTSPGCFVYLERHHGDLSVKVLAADTGAPVPGAAVRLIEGRLPEGEEVDGPGQGPSVNAPPEPVSAARVIAALSTDGAGESRLVESEYDLALFLPLPT